jgi:hypothetical protein
MAFEKGRTKQENQSNKKTEELIKLLKLENQEEELLKERARAEESLRIARQKAEKKEQELVSKRHELSLVPGGEEKIRLLSIELFTAKEMVETRQLGLNQLEEKLIEIKAKQEEAAKSESYRILETEWNELFKKRLIIVKDIEKLFGTAVERVEEYFNLCTSCFGLAEKMEKPLPADYIWTRKNMAFSYFCSIFKGVFPELPFPTYKGTMTEWEERR